MQLCPESVLRETKFCYRNRHSTFISRRQYSAVGLFRDAANSRPQSSDRMIYRIFPARKALPKTNIIFICCLLSLDISLLWLDFLHIECIYVHTQKYVHIFLQIGIHTYYIYMCMHTHRHMYIYIYICIYMTDFRNYLGLPGLAQVREWTRLCNPQHKEMTKLKFIFLLGNPPVASLSLPQVSRVSVVTQLCWDT